MKPPPSPDDPALDALFAAARARRPDTSRAEYGFETRLQARLAAERTARGDWAEFAAWCWRLVPAFAVVTLTTVLWARWPATAASDEESFFTASSSLSADDDDHFAQWLTVDWLTPI